MIINRQNRVRVARPALEKFSRQVKREMHLDGREFAVCFVNAEEMKRLNRKYRGKNKATDVLSFPAAQDGGLKAAPTFLGDIAIAPGVARRNAKRFGRTVHDELRILILHGVLHLLGYDHETDGGQMERRERHLRARFGLE
ncbi:MAG TPA: rRNA maturation RNase YbeY [Candidatus Acidoferrales bacterium]|nr:rRNA maturation RNase YbeY [Candidatus Acidoferrales bacterium]